ncbi:hypothetical protein Tco_1261747, partial [Tanacetum coccineum]
HRRLYTVLENSTVSFSIPTGGIFGEVGVNTFKNAIGAHYLAHSGEYVAPPSIDVVRQWFPTNMYGEKVSAKGTLKKSLFPPRWSLATDIKVIPYTQFWEDIILKLKKKQREKVVPYTRFISVLIMHKMKEGYRDNKTSQWSLKLPNPLPLLRGKEETKGGSSKVPTGSKTGHSKKRKESSSAMDSNLSQPLVSTTLSSGVSAFNLNVPIYLASFIIHSESASGNDASTVSIAKADPKNSAPSDFVPQQHGINEGTKNTSFDHLFAGKGTSLIARQVEEEEASRKIKLEDLAKLVSNVQPSFKDLDSPKDDPVIIVESDAEEDDGIHAIENVETKDTSVLKSSSPKSSLIQELTNQLLVKSLKTEFSNIISAHDFNSSLPTELKNLSSKFNKLTEEVKELKNQVHNLEIKLPCDFKEIPTKLELYKDCHQSLVIRHKSFEQVCSSIRLCILKTGDQSVLSAGQDDTMPAEGEKNTNQATISQLFQRKAEIGEHIKEDKGKKALSSEEAEKESTKSGSDDETTHIPGSMVESSKKKELKKFNFVTESGEHVHLTKEHISTQKKIEEEVKAEATRHEGEIRKEELIDLLGLEVVNKYYNNKLQYDKYCDKMLNRRAASRITNYDVLIRKGPITLKVYREDGTSEIISNFKASDLHLGKWREVMEACPKRTGKG